MTSSDTLKLCNEVTIDNVVIVGNAAIVNNNTVAVDDNIIAITAIGDIMIEQCKDNMELFKPQRLYKAMTQQV